MVAYIFVGLIQAAMWLFVASPFLILAYAVYALVMQVKAAKAPKVSRAVSHLREARRMVQRARENRRLGYKCAEKAALIAAQDFRKAAHACWHYGE